MDHHNNCDAKFKFVYQKHRKPFFQKIPVSVALVTKTSKTSASVSSVATE